MARIEESDSEAVVHRGGCHCGAVRFEVDGPAKIEVHACNCSMCARLGGYLHWIVPQSAFRLLEGEGAITTYMFNTGVAKHTFCRVCGIKSFYTPRSHPDCVSVSALCLDPGSVVDMQVTPFDGADWEASVGSIR